jgi:hypothetical protein
MAASLGTTIHNTIQKCKRIRRKCSHDSCNNRSVQGGVCVTHGAKRKRCSFPECDKAADFVGFCSAHGPSRRKCSHDRCNNRSVQGGVCVTHGAKRKRCSFPECDKVVKLAGFCSRYGPRTATGTTTATPAVGTATGTSTATPAVDVADVVEKNNNFHDGDTAVMRMTTNPNVAPTTSLPPPPTMTTTTTRRTRMTTRMTMSTTTSYNAMLQDNRPKSCCYKNYTNTNPHLVDIGKRIFSGLFCSPTRTPWSEGKGVILSADSCYGNKQTINIHRQSYLRQNYGLDNTDVRSVYKDGIFRYSYGTGSGLNTVGTSIRQEV